MAKASLAGSRIRSKEIGVVWSDCFNQSVLLKCSTVSVPINWDSPNGEHFDLYVVKLLARGPGVRIGNLFYQPGGPGDALSDIMVPGTPTYDFYMGSKTTEFFDFIAIDPRGTRKPNPLRCNQTIHNQQVTLFPSTSEAYEGMVTHWQEFGKSCLE
jgi:hypothetical protein